MCCQGAPMEMQPTILPWAERLGEQTAGAIGAGMRTGATPMPEDLFGAYMGAAQMPGFAQGPLQYLSQMYGGGGTPWQPMQFDPMDFYQSIYGQQQQPQPQPMPPGSYARPFQRG